MASIQISTDSRPRTQNLFSAAGLALGAAPPPALESMEPLSLGTHLGSMSTKLLLVDDDADLRFVTKALLEMDGHQVVSCGDPQDALAAFREQDAVHSFDLLLTDLQMPHLSGIELAQAMSVICPALPVLLISGSVLTSEARHTVSSRGWSFLSKPFHVPELLSHVRSLVSATTRLRVEAGRA